MRACEGLCWNDDMSTPYRSATNGIAEHAARRVKEGTSALLVQSGLSEKWWRKAMECLCYLRNIQDKLADIKSPCERKFRNSFDGRVILFGAETYVSPISTKDKERFSNLVPKCFHEFSSDTL